MRMDDAARLFGLQDDVEFGHDVRFATAEWREEFAAVRDAKNESINARGYVMDAIYDMNNCNDHMAYAEKILGHGYAFKRPKEIFKKAVSTMKKLADALEKLRQNINKAELEVWSRRDL